MSDWMIPILLAPFVGSFLGVVIERLPTGRPVAIGRSCCDHCRRSLGFSELIPLLSFLVRRGRCRRCQHPIPVLCPLIELAAVLAAISASAVLAGTGWVLWASVCLAWTLLVLAVIDYRHLILPDILTLPLIPAGLVIAAIIRPETIAAHVAGAALGFFSFAAITWLHRYCRGREGLGLGDAKLLAGMGAWLGAAALPGMVLIAALIALMVELFRRSYTNKFNLRPIAFGPYLALAFWSAWLFGPPFLA